jgi:hypothetical protein
MEDGMRWREMHAKKRKQDVAQKGYEGQPSIIRVGCDNN